MRVLSIGNSFSTDAQRYAHEIAKSACIELDTANLFIGGCSLSRHYENMLSGQREYELERNGRSTGQRISLKEALSEREWDVVTLQQVSNCSPDYETYQPYLNALAEYVRRYAPKAKIAIHQTWAYEQGSQRLCSELGYADRKDMFNDLKEAYKNAAEEINADLIIPSGAVFEALIENGVKELYRDTFHASLGIGRYALGLTWCVCLAGCDAEAVCFSDFDEAVSEEQEKIAKKCVSAVCKKY